MEITNREKRVLLLSAAAACVCKAIPAIAQDVPPIEDQYKGESLGEIVGGFQLLPGAYIKSKNKKHKLIMQEDGNLVLYAQGKAVWASQTWNHKGARATYSPSENKFYVSRPGGPYLWQVNLNIPTKRFSYLRLQDDGRLITYAQDRVLFASDTWDASREKSNTGDLFLLSGAILLPRRGYTTANGHGHLNMTEAGNLVLYFDKKIIWNSGTKIHAKYIFDRPRAVLQADGNFVAYLSNKEAYWHSNTAGNPGAMLALQDDGNLVIYSAKPVWALN